MLEKTDIAIVGAGIVGLAHAYHAAKAGYSVAVFERNASAIGATVRNFGMLAIVAQQEGAQRENALRTLGHWKHVAGECGLKLHNNGCLFLAREPEEMAVLEEYAKSGAVISDKATLLDASGIDQCLGGLQCDDLLGGLWSPDAWKIDQRQAPAKIAEWMAKDFGVTFHFSTEVIEVDTNSLITAKGSVEAKHIIICSGDDFSVLFPREFEKSKLGQCKLQMLRLRTDCDVELQPFVLGGLSMSRYSAFSSCPSLIALKRLQQAKYRKFMDFGIHLIVAQEADGSITIGDSHAYGSNLDNERNTEIDDLLLEYLSLLLSIPSYKIEERWLGYYAHHNEQEVMQISPKENVEIVTLTNGQGMTHAFSLAEDVIYKFRNKKA